MLTIEVKKSEVPTLQEVRRVEVSTLASLWNIQDMI